MFTRDEMSELLADCEVMNSQERLDVFRSIREVKLGMGGAFVGAKSQGSWPDGEVIDLEYEAGKAKSAKLRREARDRKNRNKGDGPDGGGASPADAGNLGLAY